MRSRLFKRLQELEELEFGDKNYPISGNIKNHLIPVSELLLNSIPAYMPEYTLHNLNHCEAILENIDRILPKEVELNIIEVTLLIQAALLHDIGMVVNKEAAEVLKTKNEFNEILIEFEKEVSNDEILTELIRRNHVKRSIEYIDIFKSEASVYKIDFSFKNIDTSDWVKNIILSHEKPVSFLRNESLYPINKLIDKYSVNVQFLSILLRLGDILDFDIFRTPPFLFHHINPKNKVSISEWRKHLAIEGKIYTEREIKFDAKCSEARVERLVRNFIEWIEIERRESMSLLNESTSSYKLKLDKPVNLNCRNDGSYLYTDLKLELSYEKVLHILMGTELYETPDIFIRELIQNAYDACKYRLELSKKHGEDHTPRIFIRYNSLSNILEVEDNGIGIDEEIFRNYLTKIGKSYYKSKKFQSLSLSFHPISNFGIGILSSFMVSDTIEIESLRYVSPAEKSIPLNYTLNVNDKFLDQKKSTKSTYGTTIRLHLNDDYSRKLSDNRLREIIEENMNYFEIPISLQIDKSTFILDSNKIRVPEAIKAINDILIFEITGVDWLEGFIVIHQGQHQSIIAQSKISQQCFTITGKRTNLHIAPNWLRFSRFFLNILPPRNLSLKANRNSIHEDENLFKLRNFIIEFLVDRFSSQQNLALLGDYIDDGRSSILSGNVKEFEFLTSKILFTFYDLKLKKLVRYTFKQFSQIFKDERLAIINPHLLSPNPEVLLNQLNEFELVLLSERHVNYFYQFIEPFLSAHELIVSELPGLIFYSLKLKSKIDLKISHYELKYSWVRDYPILYQNSYDRIFCVVGNNQYNSIDIQINDKSTLGILLKQNSKNLFVKRFVGSLKTNISNALVNNQKLTTYHNYNGEHHFFAPDNGYPYSKKCIGLINANFIESLNASLLRDLLLPLKSEGLINDSKLNNYLLSKREFPEWWLAK